jgi:hypothetical protein
VGCRLGANVGEHPSVREFDETGLVGMPKACFVVDDEVTGAPGAAVIVADDDGDLRGPVAEASRAEFCARAV